MSCLLEFSLFSHSDMFSSGISSSHFSFRHFRYFSFLSFCDQPKMLRVALQTKRNYDFMTVELSWSPRKSYEASREFLSAFSSLFEIWWTFRKIHWMFSNLCGLLKSVEIFRKFSKSQRSHFHSRHWVPLYL